MVAAAEAAREAAVVAWAAGRERLAARGWGGQGWETRAAAEEEALEGGRPEVEALSPWMHAVWKVAVGRRAHSAQVHNQQLHLSSNSSSRGGGGKYTVQPA